MIIEIPKDTRLPVDYSPYDTILLKRELFKKNKELEDRINRLETKLESLLNKCQD